MSRHRTQPAAALQGAKRVTALSPDKRIPGNVVIEINDARFASLPADIVSDFDLVTGGALSDELYERLSRAANVEAAYLVAVRMLAARPRAVNDLLRRLRDRGHNPSAAAEAVGRLESKGLLDDAEYARHFARVRLSRGAGPPRILTDLLSHGVERRLAERAIDEIVDREGFDPGEQARVLAERRLAQLDGLPPEKLQRRLLAYLSRRGYRGWEVRELVAALVRGVGRQQRGAE
ncbi:MAG: RecX family transcriptional regulator [Gemmatimonadota bacterium]|nr:MAG: RecX family transcriptional regulator [Gemmatimonadota bacterium]